MATIDQVDVRDLQCVVMLANTLNFTETARHLHMTQPGVTARVNRIEKNHGYRLFTRSQGNVKAITPMGFVYVEEARQVLEQLQRLITRSDAAYRAFMNRLSISRSHHADLRLLSAVIEAQAIGGAHISIHPPCNSDEEAIAMLLDGRADVAMVSWPVGDTQVSALHLTHDILVVVLPEHHALRDNTEIHIGDLRNQQIIGSKYQFPMTLKTALLQKCKAAGFSLECLCISASPAESFHLVDTGVRPGITIVTKQYTRELAPAKAALIPFAEGELAYEYGVAYRPSDHRPVLNNLLQYLVERCRPMQDRRRKPKRVRPVPDILNEAAG